MNTGTCRNCGLPIVRAGGFPDRPVWVHRAETPYDDRCLDPQPKEPT